MYICMTRRHVPFADESFFLNGQQAGWRVGEPTNFQLFLFYSLVTTTCKVSIINFKLIADSISYLALIYNGLYCSSCSYSW